jgi:hypothetical protein
VAVNDEPTSDPTFSLVLPFVCVASNGGVLDDHAFVCGATFGTHLAEIRSNRPIEWQAYVHPEMVAQYDLIAMSEGYVDDSGTMGE